MPDLGKEVGEVGFGLNEVNTSECEYNGFLSPELLLSNILFTKSRITGCIAMDLDCNCNTRFYDGGT